METKKYKKPTVKTVIFQIRISNLFIKNQIDQEILRSKFLELTDNTREEFKVKIAIYFSRPADEA